MCSHGRLSLPPWGALPLVLALLLVPACAPDDAPTGLVRPQLEGIGQCCWNPDWLNPSLFFAPIVYQDVDASWADFITRFAYDDDWNGGNNWDNTFAYPLRAFVYISMVETFSHYFIFYGFFHPRDWCTISFPLGWFCDWPVGHEHENDLEGMMVTVDKRFSTTEWPYGQVVTIETVYHTSPYPAYRNCDFTGYTVTPSPQFKRNSAWDGCIVWQEDDMMYSPEVPPARPAIFVQARGHGVKMRDANWGGFPGSDGVIYYPGDGEGVVPPSVLSPPVVYGLQWTTLHELWIDYPKSLWSKRLTSGGLATSTYHYLHQDPVGPHDVMYGHDLNCSGQPCGANAPWGINHDGRPKGDWHNHPAWTWSQHYEPGPTWNDTLYYPYCRDPGCRPDGSMYLTNFFWDPDAAPQDYVDLHLTGAATGVPAPSEEGTTRALPPEWRWEFDSMPVVAVSGLRATAAQLTIADEDWGYAGQSTGVVRVTGNGQLELTFPTDLDPSQFHYAYVRYRCVEGGSRSLSFAWRTAGAPESPSGRRVAGVGRRAGDWEVAIMRLEGHADWLQSRVTGIVLVFAGQGETVLDIDYVVVAP